MHGATFDAVGDHEGLGEREHRMPGLFRVGLAALGLSLLITMAFHELGHDEAQAWNLARASTWPWEVIANGWVEGHTPFWHVLLWPLTLSGHPVTMQLLGVALSLGAMFLMFRDRAFSFGYCLLIAFGYYPFYQYGIFPRPYTLALFLSAAIASSLYTRRGSFPMRSLLCGLLAFTSAFGVAMSAGLMFLVISEALPSLAERRRSGLAWRALLPGTAVYGALVLLACWLILFPLGSTQMELEIVAGERISRFGFLHAIESAVFPHYDRLPLGLGDWLYGSVVGRTGIAVATYAMVALLCAWLWPRPAAVIAWLLSVLGVGAAAMYSSFNAERYAGHLFMAGLAIVWAAPGLRDDEVLARRCFGHAFDGPTNARGGVWVRLPALALGGMLVYQALINAGVSVIDLREEQSPWREIATDLDDRFDEPFRVMATFGYDAGPLIAYLDKPLYDLRCDCWTRFTAWDLARSIGDAQEVEATFCALAREHGTLVAIVTRDMWATDAQFSPIGEYRPGYRDAGDRNVRVFSTDGASAACAVRE